jgi:hypothetical protein
MVLAVAKPTPEFAPVMSTTVDGVLDIIVGSDGSSLNDAGNVTKDKDGPCYSYF